MRAPKLLSLALLWACCAQAATPQGPEYSGWEWGGFVEQLQYNSAAAAKGWIEDSSTGFGVAAEYYVPNSLFTLAGGFEFTEYSDNAEFSQVVKEKPSGDIYTKSSSATGSMAFFEGGLNYPLGTGNTFVAAKLGASLMFDSSRSIESCRDCYDEDIDINGGAYALAQFGVLIGPVELGLRYKHYLSGDIESAAGVSLSSHYY